LSDQTNVYINERAGDLGLPLTTNLVALKKIILENDINAWVYSRGGECKPLSRKDAAKQLASCPLGHHAIFTSSTEIMLPAKRRGTSPVAANTPAQGAPPTGTPAPAAKTAPSYAGVAVGGLALAGLVAYLVTRD
jgi:hypothetical protein